MATIAAILDRLSARGLDQAAPRVGNREADPFGIRPIPNEDIFFFTKRIDNSMVVRQSDPRSGRACAWMIGASMSGAVALIALMLPALYGSFAGYKIEALRQEKSRLINERTELELAEAKVLNPTHLQELAKKQSFVDPEPTRIVYLNGSSDGTTVAKGAAPRSNEQAQ